MPEIVTTYLAAEPQACFELSQVSGPFRSWWHEHRFDPAPGGTLMTDVARFESPAGPLGRLVDRAVLTRYLTGLLGQRNAWLSNTLGDDGR